MKTPGPESEEARPGRDQQAVTSDRCGGWMPLLQRSRGTDEDDRDRRQLSALRGKELQGQITSQHFSNPASWSVCVCVCSSVCSQSHFKDPISMLTCQPSAF